LIKIPRFAKKRLLKHWLSSDSRLVFFRYNGEHVDTQDIDNLYLHIPFCRNTCPYCPYYKEKYDKDKAVRFEKALLAEIRQHAPWLTEKSIQSLYIGGGTPTLLNDLLRQVVDRLRGVFTIEKVAIETNPEEITPETIRTLQYIGCNLLSLGIQDFHQKHLDLLGRTYTPAQARQAIDKALETGFETVNLDFIFAYPGQTLQELDQTLHLAIGTGARQLTFYPLFTFPYSTIGRFRKLEKVAMPGKHLRKRMYYHLCQTLTASGYRQVSVWSFHKGGGAKYSSVTRDRFLGLGPSAGTYTGKQFLFNTFNTEDYLTQTPLGKLPFAYMMDVPPALERLFWVYWRLYETIIPTEDYKRLFNRDFYRDFKSWIHLARLLGYLDSGRHPSGRSTYPPNLVINKKGIHQIHLLQNHFALDFINKIWSSCTETPVPEEVTLI
jgi:oxygen-independent coproporphyrinogen-3 oxidase